MTWKPDGYPSVSPYLVVRDAERTLQFLEDVFGATRLRVIARDDGGIMHAEARIDDSVVMTGEMPGGSDLNVPKTNMHVYVTDVDATVARARAAGGTVVQEPVRKDDSDYRGGIADGDGTVWWIARQQDE